MKQSTRSPWTQTLAALCALSLCLCGVLLYIGNMPVSETVDNPDVAVDAPRIVIDPGHGGADGGAQGPDGTLEKDLNLDISLTLADLLRLFGYEVALTRETDTSIHDATATTLREQKVSDMQNRLELYDGSDLTVSIHQNKFGQAKYHGTQLFCSPNNPASQTLGATLRETIYGLLQPDNTRELKTGDKNIFLLYKTTAPAVIVECGFLSNPEELSQLKDPEYRKKFAYAVACGVLAYAP